MNVLIFSTLFISILFLTILGSWYNIHGPFLLHIVLLIAAAVAIFSAAIIIAIQPIITTKSLRFRRGHTKTEIWGRDVCNTLSSPAAILDGYEVKFINTSFLQILGISSMPDQVIGMPITNLIHPADHQSFTQLSAQAATGNIKYERNKIRLICVDGTCIPCNFSITPMHKNNKDNLSLFQFTSISSVNPLSNDFGTQFDYQSIVDRLEDIVFQLNAEGEIIFLNPAWENMLEYKALDCLNKSLLDFIHPEDKPMLESKIESLTQGKRSSCIIDARLLSMRGESNWVMLRAQKTSASARERSSVIGTMTDIKLSKEAEATRISNRRAADSLLRNIPGMVYRCRNDRSWTFESVSDGCIDVTGYDASDFVPNQDLAYMQIIHPDDRTAVWDSVNNQIMNGDEFKVIYRIVTRKGETKLVQEHGRCIFSSTGEVLALEGFITEIPNQKYNITLNTTSN